MNLRKCSTPESEKVFLSNSQIKKILGHKSDPNNWEILDSIVQKLDAKKDHNQIKSDVPQPGQPGVLDVHELSPQYFSSNARDSKQPKSPAPMSYKDKTLSSDSLSSIDIPTSPNPVLPSPNHAHCPMLSGCIPFSNWITPGETQAQHHQMNQPPNIYNRCNMVYPPPRITSVRY